MSSLTQKLHKDDKGKNRKEDPAVDLARSFPNREELQIQVLQRLNLARRQRTSISHPHDSAKPGLQWLSQTFAEINYGGHPEFSLPRRIEISIPDPVLKSKEFELRLIDTRGVDEPSAPRRDLQTYLDDERAIIVLCSGFKDAPDAAIQSVIEKANAGGARNSLLRRGLVLVFTQGEERAVRDSSTGELVDSIDVGREIRRDQARTTTLGHLGVGSLPMEFLNVTRSEDCDSVRANLVAHVEKLRASTESEIHALVATTDKLILNKENEQIRLVFEQATRNITTWIENNLTIRNKGKSPDRALLEGIDGIRYAATLRASVARLGSWPNFDYWHGLGFGARSEIVERTSEQLTKLEGIVQNILDDRELSEAHDFIRHFKVQIEEIKNDLLQRCQSLGETAFSNQLKSTHEYWSRCQNRWGLGKGFKSDIRTWTDQWFSDKERKERYEFLEAEFQRLWKEALERLAEKVKSQPGRLENVA